MRPNTAFAITPAAVHNVSLVECLAQCLYNNTINCKAVLHHHDLGVCGLYATTDDSKLSDVADFDYYEVFCSGK